MGKLLVTRKMVDAIAALIVKNRNDPILGHPKIIAAHAIRAVAKNWETDETQALTICVLGKMPKRRDDL